MFTDLTVVLCLSLPVPSPPPVTLFLSLNFCLKILIRFEGEKNSVFCLLLDAVIDVSDFARSDCWMVLVFCLVLIRF